MACWIFSRRGALVLLEAERESVQTILSRVTPYLQGKELCGERPHGVWMIQARHVASSSLHGPERLVYSEPFAAIDPLARVIEVAETSEHGVVQRVIRLLRNLFRLLLAQDAVFVHGGMIEIAGCGIAFLGAKKAGKTSSILAALTQGHASFIENDALSLHVWEGRPYGLGWFRSTYIRRDVFSALGAVFSEKHREFHLLERTHEKPSLFPEKFAAAFGCSLLPQAELHLLVFPEFFPRESSSAFSLCPMTKEEALLALKEHLVPVPNEHHQFLQPYFPRAPGNGWLLETLVERVTSYRLQQSFSAITAAAHAVIALVDPTLSRHEGMAGPRHAE
ncbi:MAG: hypothetical protein H0U76_08715 [Ktedonobacteraceae bacterium]|nr:hypothetical protein [Ktedonobacteraceae bacterium]